MTFPIAASLRVSCLEDELAITSGEATISFSSVGEHSSRQTLKLVGAATTPIDFGTLATGAKLALISLDAGVGVSAVSVSFNGGNAAGEIEISPGGFICLTSPVPTAGGVLSANVTHTTNATLRVWVFG